jgi:aminocarboxymuconate-semialdehyde decarboxylase
MTGEFDKKLFGSAVDVHGHLVSEYLVDDLNALERLGLAAEITEGDFFLKHGGDRLGPIRPGMSKWSKRLEWMDAKGIAKQWVSPWMDLFTWTCFSDSEVLEWYRLINESISRSAAMSGGRLLALGAVHLGDSEHAVHDIQLQVGELGWAGLMLNTHPGEVDSLGSPELFQFWAAVEKMGLPVLLHPPSNGPSCHITPNLLQNITGRLVDTTMLMTDLILSGFIERFPDLKLIVVHGGGLIPYQSFRLDGLSRAGLMPHGSTGRPVSQDLGKFYYDTVALDPLSIELLVRRVGVERVLLGSDAPFPIADPDPVKTLLDAALSPEDLSDICCNNAARLLSSGDSAHG